MKKKNTIIEYKSEKQDSSLGFSRLLYGFFLFLILSTLSFQSFSQEISKNNYSGDWTNNSTWTDNSNPGVNNIAANCTVFGKVKHIGNLDFGNGDLIVNDTLIIFGNLTLGNNADLTINAGGILIVYGDYTSGNQVQAIAGGYFVVTGNLTMQGANNQGSFDVTTGSVFLLDSSPGIKTGGSYTDLTCSDPNNYPSNCGYGNLTNLISSPISSLFSSGSYSLSVSGPTTFCTGGSVLISVPNDGTNYQWYNNGVAIGGATSFSYSASTLGNYHLTFNIGPQLISTDTVSVIVNTLSTAPTLATSDRNNICASTGSIVLSYSGGSMGTGATAQWYSDAGFTIPVGSGNTLSIPAPGITTTYYVRFEGTCNTTSAASVTVTVFQGGDFRTNATGAWNWSVAANWQRWNGSAWVATTSYPGQDPCAGTVTILNNTVLSLNVSPANPIASLIIADGTANITSLAITGQTLNVTGAVSFGNPGGVNGDQTIAIGTGTLNCASINLPETGVDGEVLTLSVSTGAINVSGNVIMNAAVAVRNVISFSGAGSINIGGDFSGIGTFTCSTSTVNLNGTIAQNLGAYTFYNLVFTNNSLKTLLGNSSVTGSLTINNNASFSLGTTATTFGVTGTALINGSLIAGGTSTKTITIGGNLSGTGTIDLSTGSLLHVMNLGGATNSIGSLTTSPIGSTINYNRAGDQTVFASPNYRNLTISGSGIKTLQADATVNNNLLVSAGTFTLGAAVTNFNITGTAGFAGVFNFGTVVQTVSIGGNLSGAGTINMTGAGLAHTLNLGGATNTITTFNTTAGSGSTVNYNRAGVQTIFGSANYRNLTVSGSGAKTLQANSTINNSLLVSSGIFDLGTVPTAIVVSGNATIDGALNFTGTATKTLSLTGNLDGAGSIDMSGGSLLHTLNLAGATNTIGSLTTAAVASNINYTRAGAQTVFGSPNYRRLSFSGGGIKTISGDITVGGTLTLTAGLVQLGTSNLTVANGATLAGGSVTAMVITDGTGQLLKTFPAGASAFTFPLGDMSGSNDYSPTTITYTANSTIRTVGVRVTDAKHPSDLSVNDFLSRYWSFTDDQAGTYSYTPSFSYSTVAPSDLTGTYANLKLNRWDGSNWTQYTTTAAAAPTISSTTAVTETTAPLNNSSFTGRVNIGVYNWNQAGATGNWTTATNWTPARLSPQPTDVLVFDNCGTTTATNIPSQTIGKLILSNNSNVSLQSAAAGQTITISGGTGTDLDIPAGSVLQLSSTLVNQIGIAFAPATSDAVIAGSLVLNANNLFTNSYISANSNTIVTGSITNNGGVVTSAIANLSFASGSSYNHTRNSGAIPLATWNVNSNCIITGLTNTALTPISADPQFGNFIWNCSGQSILNQLCNTTAITINGNADFLNTGTGSLSLSNTASNLTFLVKGNLTIGDGSNPATLNLRTTNSNTTTVNLAGNLTVNLNGILTQTGTNSGTVNFGYATAPAVQTVNWGGAGIFTNTYINYTVQNVPAGKIVNLTSGIVLPTGRTLTVSAGSRLNCGDLNVISGAGNFTLAAGGLLGIGHANGLNGNITLTGTRNYNATGAGTTFIYNGTSSSQVTGSNLPGTVSNLVIDNTFPGAMVGISVATTVNNSLSLSSGLLTLGNFNLTLPTTATINGTPGIANMIVTDGTGRLIKGFAVGDNPPFTFPIGDITGTIEYTPVVLDFSANSVAGTVGVNVVNAIHPNDGSSINSINRYWQFVTTGLTNYTYNALTFDYKSADINGTESDLKLNIWNGIAWNEIANSAVNTGTQQLSLTVPLTNITGALNGSDFTARHDVLLYYRSVASANWDDLNTWETSTDGLTWPGTAALRIPTSQNSAGILIQAAHTVIVPSNIQVDDIVIDGTLNINSGVTCTIANGTAVPDMRVSSTGRIINAGVITTTGTLVFDNAAVYQHNFTTSAGQIPTASWNAGSTCEIIGYTSNTAPPTGLGQAFANFTWNCPNQDAGAGGGINLLGALTTVNGNFSVLNTGSNLQYLNLANTENYTLNISGNLLFSAPSGGMNMTTGAGNKTINIGGNLTINPGTATSNFYMGSAASTCLINLSGDFNQSNGNLLENSGAANSRTITFNKAGTQLFSKSGGGISGLVNFNVNTGTTLDMGANVLDGSSGTFTLNAGATLISAHQQGISNAAATGNIQVTGLKTFNAGANYIFNYSGAGIQSTGNGFTGGNDVTISSANGASLTANAIIGGNLILNSTFDIAGRTLTLNGPNIGGNPDNLTTSATSSLSFGGVTSGILIPSSVVSLGSLTVTNTSIVSLQSNLVLSGTLSPGGGGLSIGANTLSLNGAVNCGILVGGANSNITIGGAGAASISAVVLNNLIINRAAGVSMCGNVTVGGNLGLISGALSIGANTLTVTDGASFGYGAGSLTGGATSNLTFGTGAAVSLNSISGGLNNFNVSRDISLNASLLVGGTLTISSGTFAVAANTLTLNGPAIAGTPLLSTLATSSLSFGGNASGVFIPASVSNLRNLSLNNVNGLTLNSNITLAPTGILTLTDGIIEAGANIFTITNPSVSGLSGGSPSAFFDVTTGALERNLASGIALPGQNYLFPIGENGIYKGINLLDVTTGATGPVLRASVSPVGAISGDGTSMGAVDPRYWSLLNMNTGNFTSTRIELYENGLDLSKSIGMSNNAAGNYSSIGGASNTSSIISPTVINPSQYFCIGASISDTYYSYQTGNWNIPTTWTTDPSGTLQVGSSLPGDDDKVVILSGRTVSITSDISSVNIDITIEAGGFLDQKVYSFTNSIYALRGQGTLSLASVNIPLPIINTFINSGGGTVEYDNNADFILPGSYPVYNNLIINTNGFIATQLNNLVLNGDLYVKSGRFQINNDVSVAKLSLTVNRNVIVDNAAFMQVGKGITNPAIAAVTVGGTAPFINYYTSFHTIIFRGDFTNNGTVRFNNLAYPVYNSFPPVVAGPTTGAATVYFQGASDNTLTCNGETNFYNLVVDKGTDQTYKLYINSQNYSDFRLYGANSLVGEGAGANANLRKALWVRTGTLVLRGSLIIPSLTEGNTVGPPNSDFYIPANAALVLDGPDVILLSTADDYMEINAAYGVAAPGNAAIGIVNGGVSALAVYGKLQVNDGYLSTRESGGILTSNVASGQIVLRDGVIDTKQLLSATGSASYSQTGGIFIVRGRFQRTPSSYTIAGLTDFSLASLNTSRALSGTNATYGSFNLNNATNIFSMSAGSIRIYDVCGIAAGQEKAFEVTSSAANINVTGGTLEIYPVTGTVIADAANFLISSSARLYNVDINRISSASSVKLNIYPLTVVRNMNLISGDLISNNLDLTVGGDFSVSAGTTYLAGTNTTILNGTNDQTFSVDLAAPIQLNKLTIDKPAGISLNLAGTQSVFNVSGNFRLVAGTLNDNGKTLNVAANVYNSGIHRGTGKIVMNGTITQTIDGNGLFGNLELNNTNAAAAPVSLIANCTINGVLNFSNDKLFSIGSYGLKLNDTATILNAGTSRYIQTSGNAGDGGLTKVYSSPANFTFPVGIANYTPGNLGLNSVPDAYGEITLIPVNYAHPNVTTAGRSLSYFWRVKSSGFILGSATVNHGYVYSQSNVVTGAGISEDEYVAARFSTLTNTWTSGTVDDVDDVTSNTIGEPGAGTFLENVSFIDGDYTAGDTNPTNPFGTPTIFYSRQSGLWSNINTWSLTSHTVNNPPAVVPGPLDIVIIGGNDVVTLATNTTVANTGVQNCASLRIEAGSTLDIGYNPACVFSMVMSHPNGNGVFRSTTSSASGSTFTFPSGDFSDFNVNLGTTELYSTNPASGTTYWLPNGVASYGNLIISPLGGSNIIFPNRDLLIYGNCITNGQNADSWFCPTWNSDYPLAPLVRVSKTITINGDLDIQGGSFGWYGGGGGGAQNIVVNGDVIVAAWGGIDVWGSNTSQSLSIGGSLINNTNNAFQGGVGSRSYVNLTSVPTTFFGDSNASITNTSGTPRTDFGTVTVNKGNSQADTLTCNISGVLNTPVNAWLNLQNGTFKYQRTDPGTDFNISTTTPFTIPSTAGLLIDIPSNSSGRNILIGNNANNSGDLILDGKLTLVRGDVYIGPITAPATNNDIEYSGGGASAIEVQGGTLVVNGQIRRNTSTTNGILKYTQSGGNVIINGNAANNSYAKLEVLNTSSAFNMSGGSLTIVRGGGIAFGDLYLRPSTTSVTGGTINFEHNLNGSPQTYLLESTAPLFNLTVTGRTAPASANASVGLMVSPLLLKGSLTLTNVNSIFNCNGKDISIRGDLINNGPLLPVAFNTGVNTTTFSGGIQNISGTQVSNFNNLSVMSVNSLTVNNSFTVNQNLIIGSGSLILGSSKLSLKGNLNNNGSYTDDNVAGGISLSGTIQQQISGTGAYGRLELNNNSGARLNNGIMLQNDLVLTQGILNIASNLLTLSQNTNIQGSPDKTKMILSDGVTSSLGVRKFFTTGAQSFTFPIGVAGKYTPANFVITSNASVGHININPVNSNHPSVIDPSVVLKFYWQIESSGISGFTGDLFLNYIPDDVRGNESDYVAAKLELPVNYWYTAIPGAATDDVDEALHHIRFNSVASNNLTGDYTAGEEAAFPLEIPVYQTNQDGNWSDNSIWTPVGASPPCPVGGPNGCHVIIDHIVTTDVNNCFAFRTTINNKLKIVSPTFGHNLGVVEGEGTLYLENGNIPAGNFTTFMDCSGNATIEYGGTGVYTIIASQFSSLPNMIVSGTGTRILPNKDLTFCKRLIIDGATLDNSINNRKITILGTMERYNSGVFNAGTGLYPSATVTFAGSGVQYLGGPIGDFSGSSKFNNLEINNSNGLVIGANALIEVNNNLLLTDGNILTTATNRLAIVNTASSAVIPEGGRPNSYIDGPLMKRIINGGFFQYPIGKDTIRGHNFTVISTTGVPLYWTAEFFYPNTTSGSLASPLLVSNTLEYWSVNTSINATAKIKIGWDPQSALTPQVTINGSADMRVAEYGSGTWNALTSVTSGNNNNGDVATLNSVAISSSPKNYTSAAVTTTRAQASFTPTGNICGAAGIPVSFTSYVPISLNYTLTYKVNGVTKPSVSVTSLPYVLPTPVAGDYKLVSFTYNNGANVGVVGDTIISVYAVPTPANAGPDLSLCGFSGTTLAGNNPAPYSGLWTVVSGAGGNFVNNTQYNSVFTGVLGVTYTLNWTISNFTCTSSDNVVIAFPIIAARPSNFTSAPTSVCKGSSGYIYTVPAVAGNTYNWTYSGTGHTINGTGNSVSIDFSAIATSGTLSVTASNACGTSTARSINITVYPTPTVVTHNPSPTCLPATVNLTLGAVTTGSTAGLTFTYWTNAGASIPLASPAAVSTSGTYYIKGTTANGCFDIKPVTVIVYPLTPVSFGAIASVCADAPSFNLTTGSPVGGTYSGPGITASPLFNPNTAGAGTHTLTYTYIDGNSCPNSATTNIVVNPLPVVSFSAVPDVCIDAASFNLNQGSPVGGTYSGPGITVSPVFDPSVAGIGTHTITYTYSDGNGCVNTSTQTITVHALPVVTFAAVSDVCLDTPGFNLTQGSPLGGTYSGTGISLSPTFTPSLAGAGIHNLTYTYVDAFGCGNASTQTITVNPLPIVSFGVVPDVCSDAPSFNLTQGLPAGGTYSGTGITASPSFSPLTAGSGTHTITYTYTDGNACSSSSIRNVTVNSLPAVSFAALPIVTIDTPPFALTEGSPSGGIYSGPGISISPTFDPAAAGFGTHTLTYTYTDANSCVNSSIQTITVNSLPVVTFDSVSPVCLNGAAFNLTQGLPLGGTYSGPGISASPLFNPSIAGAGTHTITYTYTDIYGSTNTATRDIVVYALPVVTFSAIPSICIDAADINLTQGLPIGGTYSGTGISASPVFSPSTAGTGVHSLAYTYTDANSCTSSASQNITVNQLPAPVVSGAIEICDPSTELYSTASFAGHSYSWNVTSGIISGGSTGNSVLVDWSGTGTGTLEVTEVIDATGCQQTSAVYNVSKFETPVLLDINSNNKLTRR